MLTTGLHGLEIHSAFSDTIASGRVVGDGTAPSRVRRRNTAPRNPNEAGLDWQIRRHFRTQGCRRSWENEWRVAPAVGHQDPTST